MIPESPDPPAEPSRTDEADGLERVDGNLEYWQWDGCDSSQKETEKRGHNI